ncbi:hypothetical protein ES705_14251 [subsurface metagenome]
MNVGGINYRKEIWAILKEFRDSKVMTLEEVTERIMAVPVPEEERGKKKKIQPCGNITKRKDLFKFRSENLGVFPKPKIERKEDKR